MNLIQYSHVFQDWDSCTELNECDVLFSGSQEDAAESEERVQTLVSSAERKQRWEQGQADYMGIDSFDNIQKKLDVFLK